MVNMATEVQFIENSGEPIPSVHELSEATRQIILKIFDQKLKPFDASELLSTTEDICNEIEQFGLKLLELVKRLRDKMLSENHQNIALRHTGRHVPVFYVTGCDESSDTVTCEGDRNKEFMTDISALKQSLEIEQKITEKLQYSLHDLRVAQEERMVRLEKQVIEAESALMEKLKLKRLEKRKEQAQNVLKRKEAIYGRILTKNVDETRRSSIPRVYSASSGCHVKTSEQGHEHIRIGEPVPPRSLRERKEEMQLKEEIKWSRITPIPVRGSPRNHSRLPLSQKKT